MYIDIFMPINVLTWLVMCFQVCTLWFYLKYFGYILLHTCIKADCTCCIMGKSAHLEHFCFYQFNQSITPHYKNESTHNQLHYFMWQTFKNWFLNKSWPIKLKYKGKLTIKYGWYWAPDDLTCFIIILSYNVYIQNPFFSVQTTYKT